MARAKERPPIEQFVTWVYTEDLPGTATFYAEVLGLELVLDQGACRIFRAAPDAFLGVCRARPGRYVEPKGVVLTLVSQSVDAWYAYLCAREVALEGPPEHSEQFNVYCFFARDPNGYLIEFQRFLNPDWPAAGHHEHLEPG